MRHPCTSPCSAAFASRLAFGVPAQPAPLAWQHHIRNPAPHAPPPLLQRYLEERVAGGADFTWSALRPNPVCGFRWAGSHIETGGALRPPSAPCSLDQRPAVVASSLRATHAQAGPGRPTPPSTYHALPPPAPPTPSTGSFMNLSTSLAVYASISKELGLPLRWAHAVQSRTGAARRQAAQRPDCPAGVPHQAQPTGLTAAAGPVLDASSTCHPPAPSTHTQVPGHRRRLGVPVGCLRRGAAGGGHAALRHHPRVRQRRLQHLKRGLLPLEGCEGVVGGAAGREGLPNVAGCRKALLACTRLHPAWYARQDGAGKACRSAGQHAVLAPTPAVHCVLPRRCGHTSPSGLAWRRRRR
jgi:hypothetical protein